MEALSQGAILSFQFDSMIVMTSINFPIVLVSSGAMKSKTLNKKEVSKINREDDAVPV